MFEVGIGGEARWLILFGQRFDGDLDVGEFGNLFVAAEEGLANDGPRGKPTRFSFDFTGQTKRERRALSQRHNGGEKIEFLRGEFGKAIHPEATDAEVVGEVGHAEGFSGFVEYAVEVF